MYGLYHVICTYFKHISRSSMEDGPPVTQKGGAIGALTQYMHALGIQSYSQIMIGMFNHLRNA